MCVGGPTVKTGDSEPDVSYIHNLHLGSSGTDAGSDLVIPPATASMANPGASIGQAGTGFKTSGSSSNSNDLTIGS